MVIFYFLRMASAFSNKAAENIAMVKVLFCGNEVFNNVLLDIADTADVRRALTSACKDLNLGKPNLLWKFRARNTKFDRWCLIDGLIPRDGALGFPLAADIEVEITKSIEVFKL